MAFVSPRSDGTYLLYYTHGKGRQKISLQTTARGLARKIQASYEHARANGWGPDWVTRFRATREWGYDRPGSVCRVTFAEASAEYLDRECAAKSTATVRLEKQMLDELGPTFGGLRLDEITEQAIEDWRNAEKDRGLRGRSVNLHLGSLRRVLDRAVRQGLIQANPARAVRLLPEPLAERYQPQRALTPAEFQALYVEAEPWLGLVLLVGILTGLRPSEMRGLEWSRIDEKRRLALVLGKGDKERWVPLTPVLARELGHSRQASGAVLRNGNGKPLVNCEAAVKRLRERCPVGWAWNLTSLRHTFSTTMHNARVDPLFVEYIMGHSVPGVAGRYTHVQPARLVGLTDWLDVHYSL